MFYPGETLEHTFIIPFYESDVDQVVVSYKQNDHVVLEKEVASIAQLYSEEDPSEIIEFCEAVVIISQQQSLLFEDDCMCEIQLNVFTMGNRRASEPISEKVGRQFYKTVYEYEHIPTEPVEEEEEEVNGNA